jgi:hypothetical protein
MVEGISGSSYQYQSYSSVSKSLTDDQKETLQSILSNYDVESMTEEEKKEMFEQLKEAGIGMSDEVKSILDEAGFTPPEKPQGPPPEEDSEKSELLQSLYSKLESGEVTEDEITSLIKSLQDSGQLTTGVFFDQKS